MNEAVYLSDHALMYWVDFVLVLILGIRLNVAYCEVRDFLFRGHRLR